MYFFFTTRSSNCPQTVPDTQEADMECREGRVQRKGTVPGTRLCVDTQRPGGPGGWARVDTEVPGCWGHVVTLAVRLICSFLSGRRNQRAMLQLLGAMGCILEFLSSEVHRSRRGRLGFSLRCYSDPTVPSSVPQGFPAGPHPAPPSHPPF